MSDKRFNSYCDNENIRIRIDDDIKNKEVFHIYFAELDDALYCKSKLNPILDLLNALNEGNEQLKQAYTQLKHRHSLLHDVCIDAECDRDSYRKDIASLEKENEQLKNNIKEAYHNERTMIGKSVLKQLMETIQ